jgi:hypothetical protein
MYIGFFFFLATPAVARVAMFLVIGRKVLWERNEGAFAYFLKSSILGAMF